MSSKVDNFLAGPRPMLIGSDWLSTKAVTEIINPSTGEPIGQVASADPADVHVAAEAAHQAFEDKRWRTMTPAARARVLWRIADLMEENLAELAELEMLNTGKSLTMTEHGEVPFAAECFRYYAGWCTKLAGSTIPVSTVPGPTHVYTQREPIGVAALIVPSNGPLVQACWKLAPALAAGCSCVLKPDDKTPLSALRLGELILAAGVPKGVVNIVTGGAAVGKAMVEHPLVAKISFTGSTKVGKEIAKSASETLKKVTLELGGKSPMIVLEDADLEQAIPGAAQAIFSNAGQICVAGSRLYVDEKVYDRVVDGIANIAKNLRVGPGTDRDAEMGPLISAAHREYVAGCVDSGIREGAEVVIGGERVELGGGFFYAPTVLANTTHAMQVVNEEIFGPVLTAMRFDDINEIARRANDSRYGLAASIWTRDINRAHRLADEIKAGLVWINCHAIPDMAMPFGGYKASGWGRENGLEGLLEYTEHKSVMAML